MRLGGRQVEVEGEVFRLFKNVLLALFFTLIQAVKKFRKAPLTQFVWV